MKVTVTGGSGFIGNYVVEKLLQQGIDVVVTGISLKEVINKDWYPRVEFIELNIN